MLGLGLVACGGRTLDDGVYGAQSSGELLTCSYQGTTYPDGSLIAGSCMCFCSRGQVECEAGCTSSGGTSSAGASGGGVTSGRGGVSSGGVSSGGVSSGGVSSGGVSSGGVSSGGAGGIGNASSGGSATAGSAGSVSGGSTGTGGTGGVSSGGSAGSPAITCGRPPRATGFPTLIDDMEDGDPYIARYDGRSGTWFTYNDGSSGIQIPDPRATFQMQLGSSDATGGKVAANTYGKGFSGWGAGMGLVLNSGCPYDASVYHGLHFFARVEFSAGSGTIYIMVPTAATTPASNGGTCVESTPTSCYDDYQTTIALNSAWVEEFVPFSALRQLGWGTPAKFDPGTITGVNFQTLYGDGTSFSFSIDSISFY